jgi:hypothetical protein
MRTKRAVVSGALEAAARRLASLVALHPRSALLAVLVLAASASGVVNDTQWWCS